MPVALHYPDLAAPPSGWSYGKVGSQVRLQPPANSDEVIPAAIVISPLVARHKGLPPIDQLILMAIETEEQLRFQLTDRIGPTSFVTTTGLAGCFYEVRGHLRPGSVVERRIYVMYADSLCYYGISYVVEEPLYEKYLKLFWDAARSVKPFQGRVSVQPVAAAAVAAEESALHNSYKD